MDLKIYIHYRLISLYLQFLAGQKNTVSDGIIGSAQETKPTLFKRLFGSDSRLHPCNIIMIRFGKSQQSHKVVLCWCNVGVRQPGIQRGRNEATQQLTDFL